MSREYPSAPIMGVGGVVIDSGRVLLVRRNHPPSQGMWSLPGGMVELGEPLSEAVIREIYEETGLKISPMTALQPVDRIELDPDGAIQFHYVLIDFLCSLDRSDCGKNLLAASSDVSEAAWVSLHELRNSNEFALDDCALKVVDEAWHLTKQWPEIFGASESDRSLK